jgi:hypothetical protein
MKSKAYRTTDVKRIDLDQLLHTRGTQAAVLGVDVSKKESRLVLRWNFDDFERPWSSRNPGEIGQVLELCRRLSLGRSFSVAMESSGTYGDALRQALSDAGLRVMRVSSKASHDYAEIFDGVDSQHDGKDAAIIAELCAMNKAAPWPWRGKEPWEGEMAVLVEELEETRLQQNRNTGRLEALLARHWPEVLEVAPITSRALQRALHHYGSPAALAADGAADRRLLQWSRGQFEPQTIQSLLQCAAQSRGVRAGLVESNRLQQIAGPADQSHPPQASPWRQAAEAGGPPAAHRTHGPGRGGQYRLRAVGYPGRSRPLSLRRRLAQGDGAEPQGTLQRPVPGTAQAQQTGRSPGPALALPGGFASDPHLAPRQGLVPAQTQRL